jgi:hypothetical protein
MKRAQARHDASHRYQPLLPCVQRTGISAERFAQPASPGR